MLLIPHDALAEVHFVLLQERRIVAEVGVTALDAKAAIRIQHAGHVPEPGIEQRVERHVGHEVVRQRLVFRPQLLAGRLRLFRVPREVEPL